MTLPVISALQAKDLIARGATLIDIRERDESARERIAAPATRRCRFSAMSPSTKKRQP